MTAQQSQSMTDVGPMKAALADVTADFIHHGGAVTQRIFEEWESRADLSAAGVVTFVKRFEHRRIFDVTKEEFAAVCATTEPPLGGIFPNRDDDDKFVVKLCGDVGLESPWSFQQVFHDYVESHGIPTWQELEHYLYGDAADKVYNAYRLELWSEYWDVCVRKCNVDASALGSERTLESMFDIGIRWRLGNFYFSALRELEVLIRLRDEHGLRVNYHLLADAAFKADFWMRDASGVVRAAGLLIESPYFGRKVPAAQILPLGKFISKTFRVNKQRSVGVYWPMTDETVRELCAFFRGASTCNC